MSLAVFNIQYQGLLHRTTTSENAAVSQSLIGLDNVLTNAARALYGYLVDPEVDIRPAEDSSVYEVDLGFRQNFGMERRALLSGNPKYQEPHPDTVLKALGLKAADLADPTEVELPENYVEGLIELLKKLAGRAIDRVFITSRQTVDIEVGDETFQISNDTYRLLRHINVRRGLEQLMRAIDDPEITCVAFVDRETNEVIETLDAGDLTSLRAVEPKEVLLVDEVRTMALQLDKPVFRHRDHWTFTDGLQKISAQMMDEDFMSLIDNGVFALKPGEVFVVNMRVVTTESIEEGLKSTYQIVRVIDHRKPGKHLLMPGI